MIGLLNSWAKIIGPFIRIKTIKIHPALMWFGYPEIAQVLRLMNGCWAKICAILFYFFQLYLVASLQTLGMCKSICTRHTTPALIWCSVGVTYTNNNSWPHTYNVIKCDSSFSTWVRADFSHIVIYILYYVLPVCVQWWMLTTDRLDINLTSPSFSHFLLSFG